MVSNAYILLLSVSVFLHSWNVCQCQELSDSDKESAFNVFDQNNDGQIGIEELKQILLNLGEIVTDEEIQDEIEAVDQNGDGLIDYPEFVALLNRQLLKDTVAEVKNAFGFFDEDGNGFVTKQEIIDVLTNLGQQYSVSDIVNAIKDADTNGDGALNFKEFMGLLASNDAAKVNDAVIKINDDGLNSNDYDNKFSRNDNINDNVYTYECNIRCIFRLTIGLFAICLTIGLTVITLISLYKQCKSENKL